jgi:hypothetical protein
MVTIHLKGQITETGELRVELPKHLPPGEVSITLELPIGESQAQELQPLTDAEIIELMRIEPKTGAEIAAAIGAGLIGAGWSDLPMSGADWVEEQRRKHQRQFPAW